MNEAAIAAAAAASVLLPPELFSGLVAVSADAVVVVDDDLRIVYFNAAAERIFGWPASEAWGQKLSVLLPERFRAAHEGHVHGFAQAHERSRLMGARQRIAGLRRSGEEFPAEASIARLAVPGGMVYTAVLRDVTERRRAEDTQRFLAHVGSALAESLDPRATLERVAELAVPASGGACVAALTVDGSVRAWAAHGAGDRGDALRAAAARVVADGTLATLAAVPDEAVPDEASTDEPALAALAAAAGLPHVLAVPLVARGAVLGVVACLAARPYDDEARALAAALAGRAAVALDNATLHERARAALRARDDMAAIVSHDLRNPVQAVRMLAGALLAGDALPPDAREQLGVVRQAADQMDALIRDLLDATTVEAGRLRVEPEAADAARLVLDAVEAMRPLADARRIALEADVARVLPPVLADAERVGQLFSNLIGNALKFTPTGGRVTVRAVPDEAPGGPVRFAVADTGSGIAPEALAHVFDRYWQARAARRAGAGLGLYISRGIVEAHGGEITVDSTPEGTTVRFTLPVA